MSASLQKIYYKSARSMDEVKDESVALVLTSPPYPMIEMWDGIFSSQDERIEKAFKDKEYYTAFELMHELLNDIWKEVNRVLIPGGIVCINIGDATRTFDGVFRLFSNHSRIIRYFEDMNFNTLPDIIWRKPTNAPNKFMGSGMYPPGAYVTFEHEYILIFRKGSKRLFSQKDMLEKRHESSYFWEERNIWFSDIWEIKGTGQNITGKYSRERSAAFPFELAYRLINMFSIKGDTVLDPFLGTGTTLLATIASERNGIGYEIDSGFSELINNNILSSKSFINDYISDRLKRHIDFINAQKPKEGSKLYTCSHHNFPVKTRQETDICIRAVSDITQTVSDTFHVEYDDNIAINEQLTLF